jgi:hypothetical protein
MSFSTLQQSHRNAIAALTAVLVQPAEYGALSDEELLLVTRYAAEERRLVDTVCAVAAGQLARRSAPELGSAGLAQRTGHRTAQELVRVTTGSSFRDAATSVRVGMPANDAVAAVPTQPWLRAVGLAVTAGTLSAAAADAISTTTTGTSNATTPTTGQSPHPTSSSNAHPSACTREAGHSPNPTAREPDEQGTGNGKPRHERNKPAVSEVPRSEVPKSEVPTCRRDAITTCAYDVSLELSNSRTPRRRPTSRVGAFG